MSPSLTEQLLIAEEIRELAGQLDESSSMSSQTAVRLCGEHVGSRILRDEQVRQFLAEQVRPNLRRFLESQVGKDVELKKQAELTFLVVLHGYLRPTFPRSFIVDALYKNPASKIDTATSAQVVHQELSRVLDRRTCARACRKLAQIIEASVQPNENASAAGKGKRTGTRRRTPAKDKALTAKQIPRHPLSEKANKVYAILLALPPERGLIGKALLEKLDGQGVFIDHSTLTSRIIPELRPYGVMNKPRIGYYIPPEHRPRADAR